MKIVDIRQMTTDEVYNELVRLRRHRFDLKSQAVTEKLEDPTQLGKTKRDVARLLTVLVERGERNIDCREIQLERQSSH